MLDTRHRSEGAPVNLTGSITKVALFMLASAACWLVFNQFEIASPEGFDAVRFEYFARYGLPEAFADSSSYRMVLLLEAVYQYLPYYWGYVFFVGILLVVLVCCDSQKITKFAMYSPISFYYLGQTGKDGIAILSLLAIATVTTGKLNAGKIIFVGFMICLAYYVRPAILLFIPIAAIQFRLGTAYAVYLSAGLAILFTIISDFYQITSILAAAVTSYETGEETAILRQFTFGYELQNVVLRIGLLSISVIFQPILGFVKSYNSGELYLIFDAFCISAFVCLLIRDKLLFKFMISSIPYVLAIGYASPYYHFRYLAIAYPAIWVYSYYASNLGVARKNSAYYSLNNSKF